MFSTQKTLCHFYSWTGSWMTTWLGKSCSFGLPRVPFVKCCQFMHLVISLLVLRAGCGIWLCQFLIIAYLFTLIFPRFTRPIRVVREPSSLYFLWNPTYCHVWYSSKLSYDTTGLYLGTVKQNLQIVCRHNYTSDLVEWMNEWMNPFGFHWLANI